MDQTAVPVTSTSDGMMLVRSLGAQQQGVYYHVIRYDVWPDIRQHGLDSSRSLWGGGPIWCFSEVANAVRFADSFTNPEVPPCIVVIRTDRSPEPASHRGIDDSWHFDTVRPAEVYDVIRPQDLHHYRTASKTAMPDGQGWWYHYGSSVHRYEEGQYVHLGTWQAARDRFGLNGSTRTRERSTGNQIFRVKIGTPRAPLGSPSNPIKDDLANAIAMWEESEAWERGQMPEPGAVGHWALRDIDLYKESRAVGYRGAWTHDCIYYRNKTEDAGSISVAIDSDLIQRVEQAPPSGEGGPDHGQMLLWARLGSTMSRPEDSWMADYLTEDVDDALFPDEVGGRRFYHATDARLSPGDLLEAGRPSNFIDEPLGYVYMAERPEQARQYGRYLYEVRPTGPIGRRPDARPEQGYWASIYEAEVVRLVSERTASLMAFTAADYWGGHRPNSTGPRAFDLLEPGDDPAYAGEPMVPGDVYTSPHFYTGFRQYLPETTRQLAQARGNPRAQVTIYRAMPETFNRIDTGDWVTLSKAYAEDHAYAQGPDPESDWYDPSDPEWHVVSAQVAAEDVRWAIDDMMEWGYFGPPTSGRRAARKTAAGPREFYRGIWLSTTPRRSRTAAGVVWEVTSGGWDETGSRRDSIGLNWTTDKVEAERFASHYVREGEKVLLPVLLTAWAADYDVLIGDEAFDPRAKGFAWISTEPSLAEPTDVRIREGADIHVVKVEIDDGGGWRQVGGRIRALA